MNHILASKRDRATAHSEASVCLSVTTPHRKPVGIVVGGWTWVSQQICFFISVGLRVGRAGGRPPRGAGGRAGPTGGRTSEAKNGSAELHISSFGCGPIAHPGALVHSIRSLAARSIVLSNPRAHWVSGDRPLRCIRVPIRDAPPPPETRGYVWRGVGRGLVNKHAFFLLLGLRVGRAGGRRPTVEGRAWGGPTGGRASEANMDRHYYRYPLSGADQITYVVFRGRAILHMTCGGAQL